MGIVGGKGGEALSLIQKLVEQVPAIAPIVFDGTAMVVDFHCMSAIDGAAILHGELRPGGVRYAHKGSGCMSAARQLFAGFAFACWWKIERQACGNDMPKLAHLGLRGVQFG